MVKETLIIAVVNMIKDRIFFPTECCRKIYMTAFFAAMPNA